MDEEIPVTFSDVNQIVFKFSLQKEEKKWK